MCAGAHSIDPLQRRGWQQSRGMVTPVPQKTQQFGYLLMPVVLRDGDLVVRLYPPPREHPPPHVHVLVRGGGEVVVALGREEQPPRVLRLYRASARDVIRAVRLVERHEAYLYAVWRVHHAPQAPD